MTCTPMKELIIPSSMRDKQHWRLKGGVQHGPGRSVRFRAVALSHKPIPLLVFRRGRISVLSISLQDRYQLRANIGVDISQISTPCPHRTLCLFRPPLGRSSGRGILGLLWRTSEKMPDSLPRRDIRFDICSGIIGPLGSQYKDIPTVVKEIVLNCG